MYVCLVGLNTLHYLLCISTSCFPFQKTSFLTFHLSVMPKEEIFLNFDVSSFSDQALQK